MGQTEIPSFWISAAHTIRAAQAGAGKEPGMEAYSLRACFKVWWAVPLGGLGLEERFMIKMVRFLH